MTHTSLHQLAISTLALIAQNNDAIQATKDNLVALEKDQLLHGSIKQIFIEQQQEILNTFREIKQQNIATYAEVMKRLNQPIIDRMAIEAGGKITNVLIAEKYYNHD